MPPLWIVATDFSPGAEAAFHRALDLAPACGAQLLLLHVVLDLKRLPGFFVTEEPLERLQHELEEEAGRQLEAWLAEARRRGVAARTALRRGAPVATLLAAALEEGAALLVVGQSAEEKQGRRLCGGSTAAALFHHPPCPLLVVPPE
ncbi:MAG: universal stress protein [Nitrospirae bacterium]|nr:MAG: universal stress protein [Nitrospirota bacterium]